MNEIDTLKLPISKENLNRPTQEVVIKIYREFLDDYNEKITDFTKVPPLPDLLLANYEPEETLFSSISRFLEDVNGMKFTLADIYQPASKRTINFVTICRHFLKFADYLLNEMDSSITDVFENKQKTSNLLLEQQDSIDEINENAKAVAELIENGNLIKEDYKSTENVYKDMKTLQATKEKLYLEKKNQIENLKFEFQNAEHELKSLGNIENDLLKQRMSEAEYQNILHTLTTLKNRLETLDNDLNDIEDGLEHENKILQHNSDCIRILSKCDCIQETVNKLIHIEDELKIALHSSNKLLNTKLKPAKEQNLKDEEKVVTLKHIYTDIQNEYKRAKDNYTNNLFELSQEINKIKDIIQDQFKNNTKIILDYEKDIAKAGEDLDKLKKTFTNEYIKASKAEKLVVDKFKDVLMRFKEMEYN